ncbi:MAG: sulfite exporter TauE/SafE family protein [Chitinophagia bacterium]|nr:sulfite exporter TauE/SafE family protein [Chitinophagia bacterium]
MNMYTFIILIIIGLVAGFISGLIGIGGGVFIVPALVMLLGYSQKAAQGTSLGILLLPVGILAVYKYYQHGYINPGSVLIMAGAFLVGSLLGSQVAMNWSDQLVKKAFALILLLISLKMLVLDDYLAKKSIEKNTHPEKIVGQRTKMP